MNLDKESPNGFQKFIEGMTSVVQAFQQMAEAFRSIADYRVPDIQSAHWYAMAGRPYGNNTRGKKRWLREMKHS